MYYAHQLFVKKGALGKIWLAGTLFKKLSKHAIMSANVEEMVLQIKDPVVKLALCTQARLALGTVRIHGRKSYYLLTDAVDARVSLTKKEQGRINLLGHELEAKPDAITLQVDNSKNGDNGVEDQLSLNIDNLDPTFDLNHFSLDLEDVDISSKDHLAREEDITLHECALLDRSLGLDPMNLTFDHELQADLSGGGDFDLLANGTIDGGNTLTTGGASMSMDLSQRFSLDDQLMTMPPPQVPASPMAFNDAAATGGQENAGDLMNIDVPSLPGGTQDLIGSPLVRKDPAAAYAHSPALSQQDPIVRQDAPLHIEREEELRKQQKAQEKQRRKRERQLKKRKRDPKLGFDSITELSDNDIRAQLSDASDLVIVRPTRVTRSQLRTIEEQFALPTAFVSEAFFCEDLNDFFAMCVTNKKRVRKSKRRALNKAPSEEMNEMDVNQPPNDDLPPEPMAGFGDNPEPPQGELWENRSHAGSHISVEMRRGINLPDDQLSVHSRNSFLGRSLDDDGGVLRSAKAFRDDASLESRERIMPLDGRRLSLGSSVDGDRAPLRELHANGLGDVPEHHALSHDLLMNDISFGENDPPLAAAGSVNLSQFDGETAVSGNFASTVASASVANGGLGSQVHGGSQVGDASSAIPASQIPVSEETERSEPSLMPDIPEVSRLTMIFRSEMKEKITERQVMSRGQQQGIHLNDIWNSYAPVSRRDASLCFLQLLVLKSMDVVQVQQEKHHAPIAISKGPKYDSQFSESQF